VNDVVNDVVNHAGTGRPVAPQAARHPISATHHGITRIDEYHWLRADNWQQVMRDPSVLAADIRAHLVVENDHTAAILAPTEALQATLVAEMRARIKEDDSSVPAPDGPFAYYTRHREGGQHPLYCRTPRAGGAETVLVDGDALASGKAFFRLAAFAASPDHSRIAYAVDEAGSELFSIKVIEAQGGAAVDEAVGETSGACVWLNDGSGFLYVKLDDNHRPSRVYRHRLGTPQGEDGLVYEESDPGLFVSIGATQSRRFCAISIHDHEMGEVRLVDLDDPNAMPRLVEPRAAGVQYDVEHHPDLDGADTLVIRTNAEGAEDFKIVTAPLASPGRANWRDLIAHEPGTYRLAYAVLKDWLLMLERQDSLPRIVVRHHKSGETHTIAFAESAYSLGLEEIAEFDTGTLRFVYSSMTTPAEVFDYDIATRQRTLRKRQVVPSGHDPARYVTRRLMAPAPDGELVPVSLVHHIDTPLDGSAPCLLYGYGSYGISMPANFATGRLSLVDRGFIYAIAHIRGGTEKGWRWYREGKLAAKPNTFSDFIAAGEHLVAQGFARAGRIVAHGGSAGGMLMGAVANLRPDLFAGLIAEVAFVDVLNTMLDDTLPLTPPEWPEWGNPIADAQAYQTIAGYCPYSNVAAKPYPAILALAGLTDPRVTYWEPAKWIARLRAHTTGTAPMLLRTNMDAGHGGAAGRFDRLNEVALAYAFALWVTGKAGD
jgi:oligopeptidase B